MNRAAAFKSGILSLTIAAVACAQGSTASVQSVPAAPTLPPVWTATIPPSDPPTSIPPAPPTPAPVPKRPMDVIPSESEMPEGFSLLPQYSGPLDVPGGSGNRVTYENHDNLGRPLSIWAVEYIVNVFPSQNAAASFYETDTTEPSIAGWTSQLTRIDRPVPAASESDLFVGVNPQSAPLQIAAVSFSRFDNIVLVTTVIGTASDDLQASTDALGTSTWYFVDLAAQNISS